MVENYLFIDIFVLQPLIDKTIGSFYLLFLCFITIFDLGSYMTTVIITKNSLFWIQYHLYSIYIMKSRNDIMKILKT